MADTLQELKNKLKTATGKERLEVLLQICSTPGFWGDIQELETLHEAMQLTVQFEEPNTEAEIMRLSAVYERRVKNNKRSVELFEGAFHISESIGDIKGMVDSELGLCTIHITKAEYELAIRLSKVGLERARKVNYQKGMGDAYHLIGMSLNYSGQHEEAMKYFQEALRIKRTLSNSDGMASTLTSISLIHKSKGEYPEALQYQLQALQIYEQSNNRQGQALCFSTIGALLGKQKNEKEELRYKIKALEIFTQMNDKFNIANSLNDIGNVYVHQKNYAEALKYHFEALRIREEIEAFSNVGFSLYNIGCIQKEMGDYDAALKTAIRSLQVNEKSGEKPFVAMSQALLGDVYTLLNKYDEAAGYLHQALDTAQEMGTKSTILDTLSGLKSLYQSMGAFDKALEYFEQYHEVHNQMLGEQSQKQLTQLNFTHNMEQKEKDLEIAHLRNVELKREKDRSESLLLNILPSEVAEELKEKGSADAKLFDEVTVLFTDFKGFTTVSERLTPQELVNELHECFKAFDEIMERHGIEKIKTVGDAYLAAAGLPAPNPTHAEDIVQAALELRDFIVNRHKQFGDRTFEMRVGLHSGKVVAGIVGVKKFAYDIWGDTVNTAARMEQNGEAGKVNISESTYELVKDKFKCEYRGEIEAKNKGKLKMYFVDSLR